MINAGEVGQGRLALVFAREFLDRAIEFELVAPDDPVPVRGHAWMLRELMRNLLHNAVRATPPGAALTVRVESDATEARLVVSDSGPGIRAEQRERLFEPFHTGHPTTGSGLGLTICREVCMLLGGRIELNNRGGDQAPLGLDAVASFPLAAPQSAP